MKKILSLIIAVLCFSSMTVFATNTKDEASGIVLENTVITVNEDYTELNLQGESYANFNSSLIDFSGFQDLKCLVELSDVQEDSIYEVKLYINFEKTIIKAEYTFKNGSTLSVAYLKQSLMGEYNILISNDWKSGEIDFYWPEENKINITKDKLLGETVNLVINKWDNWDVYDISAMSQDKSLKVSKGKLIANGQEYYYLDFSALGILNADEFYIYDYEGIAAYKITNEDLCDEIEDAIEKNYHDDYGFFDDDKFTKAVSDILLAVLFFVIPLAVFILFLIFALRSKTCYKKLFRIIYISAFAVLVIFVILAIIL